MSLPQDTPLTSQRVPVNICQQIKTTGQFHGWLVSELKAYCLSQTVSFAGGQERQWPGEADLWEELQEAPLAMCRQTVHLRWIPTLKMHLMV